METITQRLFSSHPRNTQFSPLIKVFSWVKYPKQENLSVDNYKLSSHLEGGASLHEQDVTVIKIVGLAQIAELA